MKFTLTIDLDKMPEGDQVAEVGRVLRYWAGALKDVELSDGAGVNVYDSSYTKVGRWQVSRDQEA